MKNKIAIALTVFTLFGLSKLDAAKVDYVISPRNLRIMVEKGDNLWKIAKQIGGNPLFGYPEIDSWKLYLQNRDQIEDPIKIYPGQVLKYLEDQDLWHTHHEKWNFIEYKGSKIPVKQGWEKNPFVVVSGRLIKNRYKKDGELYVSKVRPITNDKDRRKLKEILKEKGYQGPITFW
jgi:LysM repeat protein